MNRIDRVTAILIQLQSKRVTRAQEIADRFSISLRTVYRDIRTLEEAGIPVIGEAGVGYSIMDGYRLPPVMFSKEEAAAFLVAEKIVEKYTDPGNSSHFSSAMFKLRSVLRSSEKEFLEEVDNNIVVLRKLDHTGSESSSVLQTILEAVSGKRLIEIRYKASYSSGTTTRSIEPVGIFFQSGFWYLIAFCRLRNDYRNFKVERILSFTVLDEHFDGRHPTLNEYLSTMSVRKELAKIVIRVDADIIKYMEGQKYYHGFVSEMDCGDRTEMTFLSSSIEGFARWYLMFATHAQIIGPDFLKELVRGMLSKISEGL